MASLNASPVTVVCPSGVLNAESASRLEQELVSVTAGSKASELVVDMSRVDSLDNGGLVSFMSALNAAKPHCESLSICAAPPSVRIVFELTQMDRLFTMVDRTPVALAA
ncbi:MAG: STAS domain-containing protein [Cyanobacteria bacterium J06649_4]